MDDRQFDTLARSLASGGSRRQVLKGLFGLAGGALAGATLHPAGAARRPVPTPKPVRCPGQQYWDGVACVCPDETSACGPACCSAGATCCDNACCDGACYGEELCCPSSRTVCAVSGECCPEGWSCCPDFGCTSPEQCCSAMDCEAGSCQVAECAGDRTCEYAFDCGSGSNCCPADACYRRDCLGDGSCSDPLFDCRGEEGIACCGEGAVCGADGTCCTPSCEGVACGGNNGCDGICGCPEGYYCLTLWGESFCVPDVG